MNTRPDGSMNALVTDRLNFREMREDDFEVFAGFAADQEVMQYMGGTLSREEAWRHLAMLVGHWQLRGFGSWALEHKETGSVIGRMGFNQPEGWPGFELGWLLGRAYWGYGYATEAAHQALQYAFTELKRDHVISVILPDNTRSIRLATRIGETYEWQTEVRGFKVHVYGIGRDDYRAPEKNP